MRHGDMKVLLGRLLARHRSTQEEAESSKRTDGQH